MLSSNVTGLIGHAKAALEEGRFAEVLQAFRERKENRSANEVLAQAQALDQDGRADEAIALLGSAADASPVLMNAFREHVIRRTAQLDAEGLADRATALLEAAADANAADVQLLAAAGDRARAQGRRREAADLLDRHAALHAKSARIQLLRIMTHLDLRQPETAAAVAEEALALIRDDVWVRYWSVWTAVELRQLQRAEALLAEAEQDFPGAGELKLSRALFFDRAVRFRELAAHIAESADLRAQHPTLCYGLYVNACLSLADYPAALGAAALFDLGPVPPMVRMQNAWRILMAVFCDAAAAEACGAETIARLVPEMAALETPDAYAFALKRIGEFFYRDNTSFQRFTETIRTASPPVGGDSAVWRAFLFWAGPMQEVPAELIQDIIGLVRLDDYTGAYLFLAAPGLAADARRAAVRQLVEAAGDHQGGRFAAYLLTLVTEPEQAARFLEEAPEAPVSASPQDAASALASIRAARAAARLVGHGSVTPESLKVAICVSGQLRGYRTAFPTWKYLGLDAHQVTTFVDTWADVGRKTPTPLNLDRCFEGRVLAAFNDFYATRDFGEFARRYPTLTEALANSGVVDEEGIRAFYGAAGVRVQDDRAPPYGGMANPEKMYRKIQQANDLALESGLDFDLVIRIRPDIPVLPDTRIDWRAIRDRSAREGMFFCDLAPLIHLEMGVVIGDQMGVGTPEVMNRYAETWRFLRGEPSPRPYSVQAVYTPHTSLVWNMIYGGLRTELLPGLSRERLVGPDPLPTAAIEAAIRADLVQREPDWFDEKILEACALDRAAEAA